MLASITSSWNFVQHPVKKLFFGSWSDEVVTHRSKSSFSATSAQQLEGTFQLFCIIPFSSLKTAPVPVQSVRLDTPQQSNYKLKIKLRMVANNELTYVLLIYNIELFTYIFLKAIPCIRYYCSLCVILTVFLLCLF